MISYERDRNSHAASINGGETVVAPGEVDMENSVPFEEQLVLQLIAEDEVEQFFRELAQYAGEHRMVGGKQALEQAAAAYASDSQAYDLEELNLLLEAHSEDQHALVVQVVQWLLRDGLLSDEELLGVYMEGDDWTPGVVPVDIDEVSTEDSVALFLKQMAVEPLLTANQEVRLAKIILAGSKAKKKLTVQAGQLGPEKERELIEAIKKAQRARMRLARANARLVVSIAKRYFGQGLSMADLIQEGSSGLMRAVDKYDHTKGFRFSTYATSWIRQAITRALSQKTRTIRLPSHVTEALRRLGRARKAVEQEVGHIPSEQELAANTEFNPDQIRDLGQAQIVSSPVSLEKPVDDEDGSEFGDFLEDDQPTPEEVVTFRNLQQIVKKLLTKLKPRDREVLELRFGLSGGSPMTLEEVGNQLDLSRERIRQIEAAALRQLRAPKNQRGLRDFLE